MVNAVKITRFDELINSMTCHLVVKVDSINAGGPGSISSAGRNKKCSWSLLSDRINRSPLYHCTLWASKRSLKVNKCVGFLDVLRKLY